MEDYVATTIDLAFPVQRSAEVLSSYCSPGVILPHKVVCDMFKGAGRDCFGCQCMALFLPER